MPEAGEPENGLHQGRKACDLYWNSRKFVTVIRKVGNFPIRSCVKNSIMVRSVYSTTCGHAFLPLIFSMIARGVNVVSLS